MKEMETNLQILSDLTHHMKYAKYLSEKKRRETYKETVDRNKKMHISKYPELRELIDEAYESVYSKKVIPSMRSMQFAGPAIEVNPSRMFNCSYLPITDIHAFAETMFLLLSGCGVGYSVQRHHVDELPELRKPIKSRRYLIQDSIEGWADSIKVLMKAYFADRSLPLFDYRSIREKGARLIISGGKAPGAEPLKRCLNKIQTILDSKGNGDKLTPLESHDILCLIADAVLAGGIRRSALISLFSIADDEMMKCKTSYDGVIEDHLGEHDGVHNVRVSVWRDEKYCMTKEVFVPQSDYEELKENGKIQWFYFYPERARSNNSIVIARPLITKDLFETKWDVIKTSGSGEPGLYFTNNIELGSNPCCEISLNPYQFCNLTSINVSDAESQEDLNDRARVAAFMGTLQASYTDFHYLRPQWKKQTEKEALLGVSLTGIASIDESEFDFAEAAYCAVEENEKVAQLVGVNPAKRITCIKPEGTGSLVLGTSSGIHAWHNEYYVRRLRVGKNEAIYKYLLDTIPEIIEDEVFGDGAVVTIPVKAPHNAKTRTEDVEQFLNRIKYFTNSWIAKGHNGGMNTHNVSATVSIKEHEWSRVSTWLWNNQDSFNGLSFLPYDTGTYVQAPFEDITEPEYQKFSSHIRNINLEDVFEDQDNTNLQGELACSGGACEI
jgi:ribonucleoside-diphosphate reductase alpha chain